MVNVSCTEVMAGENKCGALVNLMFTLRPFPLILFNTSILLAGMYAALASYNTTHHGHVFFNK